jgi:hypothetical protein
VIQIGAFCVAGLLWLWVLMSTIRDRRTSRPWRIATFVGLALVVPAVGVTYFLVAR